MDVALHFTMQTNPLDPRADRTGSRALIVAAACNFAIALLHIVVIVGGPAWYLAVGAGARLANADAAGEWWPAFLTLGIAAVFFAWALYALSGAGVLNRLPWLRLALVTITSIYLARGALPMAVWLQSHPLTPFVWWTSGISAAIGLLHAIGLKRRWADLSPRS